MVKVIIKPDNQDEELVVYTRLEPKEIKTLIEEIEENKFETAILSESALKDWLSPEEEEAWKDL